MLGDRGLVAADGPGWGAGAPAGASAAAPPAQTAAAEGTTWDLLFGARPGARGLASRLLPYLLMAKSLLVVLVNLCKPSERGCTSLL